MIAYVLNKEINGQKLLEDIQKLINSKVIENNNSESLVLVVDVRRIVEDNTSLIPKIEYHQLDH